MEIIDYSGFEPILEKFVPDLRSGKLLPILSAVQRDETLLLEIRPPGSVTIYYRGAGIITLGCSSAGYRATLSKEYMRALASADSKALGPPTSDESAEDSGLTAERLQRFNINIRLEETKTELHANIKTVSDAEEWYKLMPLLKSAVDFYYKPESPSGREREFQQVVVRENNITFAVSSDYFICDIEYGRNTSGTRFDLVGAFWPSPKRRATKKPKPTARLALFEMKYGKGAVKGKSGVEKHHSKLMRFLGDNDAISDLKRRMQIALRIKGDLGLLPQIEHFYKRFGFTDEPPIYIFILTNHVPKSTLLSTELNAISQFRAEWKKQGQDVDVRIATSTFSGYALFEQGVIGFEDFMERYSGQIRAPRTNEK